ncbi:type 11 methyltransferase [Rhodopirellula maiorica SM1]|uniref:Type 11 methyltransferase n=1 Tax=Rhodopirellula maiorica SM1 TaxID=1265738 RepID=M5R7F6_9BACT|nr:methyltransferase domain-containing protein [Rhodopirellula maiorica]EMI15305.1 type 11 methyltransferase [Rhodopirellula maiorica SM1]
MSENLIVTQDDTRILIRSELLDKIACPDCKSPLSQDAGSLRCSGCNVGFPVIADGRLPILHSADSEFAKIDVAWSMPKSTGKKRKSYRQKRLLPQTDVTNYSKPDRQYFLNQVQGEWILNVGSGEPNDTLAQNWANLDIFPHENCDVVGDAHWLPFRDGSFGAVTSDSVLEHVRRPFDMAAEMVRVLKPGGLLWCSVPFAHPIHADPDDYFRYSPEGLKMLFHECDVIRVGPTRGPISAIAHFAERAAEAMLPGKAGFAARWLTAWAIQPFKYLDPRLLKRDPNCACSFFILLKKR